RTVQQDGFRLNAQGDRPANKRGPVGEIGRDQDEKEARRGRVPEVTGKAWHDSFPPGGVKGSVPSGIQAGWFPLVGYDKREVSKTRRSREPSGTYQLAGWSPFSFSYRPFFVNTTIAKAGPANRHQLG